MTRRFGHSDKDNGGFVKEDGVVAVGVGEGGLYSSAWNAGHVIISSFGFLLTRFFLS